MDTRSTSSGAEILLARPLSWFSMDLVLVPSGRKKGEIVQTDSREEEESKDNESQQKD